jgi:predicted nucleotidyltransferase
VAVVREVSHHTYFLDTPSGRQLEAQRDQITLQREDLLPHLGLRQWDYRKLERHVFFSSVVGSQAWGLANEKSDEDIRGCFLAPFDEWSGLWDFPDEIQSPDGDSAYWEIEKLVEQGLRGDANTLETLWSPLVQRQTPLGNDLITRRHMFVSMNILGSFGRYAQSQFKKIERSLTRSIAMEEMIDAIEAGTIESATDAASILSKHGLGDAVVARKEVHAACRSLFDRGLTTSAEFASVLKAVAEGRGSDLRPKPHRPKNAYNLLRLMHSCLSWLRTSEPLIEVAGDLRARLLAVKNQEVPIEEVVQESKDIATEIDDAAKNSKLPEHPDINAADEFLRMCRRRAARAVSSGNPVSPAEGSLDPDRFEAAMMPSPLPPDIKPARLDSFLRARLYGQSASGLRLIWVGITGAHAYGFPSPDSDLDLKAIHVAPACEVLGLNPKLSPVDFLGDWQGREYDFTSHELGKALKLAIAGNGNVLERLLGPLPALTTDLGRELAELTQRSLSRKAVHHYRGFFKGMLREYEVEAKKGIRRAKRLLYAYRVALTGRHLMLTGEIVTNVRELVEDFPSVNVKDLIEVKESAEYANVPEEMAARTLVELPKLEEELVASVEASPLPESPPNVGELSEFLVRARKTAELT